jgi:hypothetical protein
LNAAFTPTPIFAFNPGPITGEGNWTWLIPGRIPTLIDADLVAMGNYESVKRSIDAGAGNNIVSNNDLMRQINDLENSNVWAVGRLDALASSGHFPAEIQAQIPAIQWFSAAGHVNGGVSGTFKAEARDEESAKNLHDVLNGILAMVRMQANTRPELKTVVDSLQLTGDGKNIALSFTLPSELLDALEAMAKQHGAAQ